MIETLIFIIGFAAGTFVASTIATARVKKMLHKRGEALREIAAHKWDSGKYNDAVVITRMALKGLEE